MTHYYICDDQFKCRLSRILHLTNCFNVFDIRAFALQKSHDVRFACESKVAPNGDVEVVLAAKNDSTASRRISVVMCATARYYTGVQAEELDEKKMEVDLEPGQRMCCFFSPI